MPKHQNTHNFNTAMYRCTTYYLEKPVAALAFAAAHFDALIHCRWENNWHHWHHWHFTVWL